jgi:hypothetical protein
MVALALIGGMFLGWLTGRSYQRATRAWGDYRGRRAELAILRTLAWAATRPAALFVLFAIMVAGYALYLAATGQR